MLKWLKDWVKVSPGSLLCTIWLISSTIAIVTYWFVAKLTAGKIILGAAWCVSIFVLMMPIGRLIDRLVWDRKVKNGEVTKSPYR